MKINFENWDLGALPTIVICILLPLLFYFVLWLVITGCIGTYRMVQSKKWLAIKGKIISTEVNYENFGAENGEEKKYVKVKTYFYSVNGSHYTSNQTLASDSLFLKEFKSVGKNDNETKLKQVLSALKSGEKLNAINGEITRVYYNPKNPKTACLDLRFNKEILLQIIMGLLFGIGLCYLSYYLISPILEF